jgi:Domain of unknown function (DUF4388)
MEPLKNSGTFSEISCPRLLAQLHQSHFDGTVRISRGGLLKLLFFRSGEIAMASSNDQADHLAPILIKAGKLKPEQMDLARKSATPGTSLARVLVQMGFLTSGELFAGARQQLRQIVASLLGLTDAAYEIQAGYFPREITSLNVDTLEMLLDVIRDLPDRSFVLLEVGAPDTVYVAAGTSGNGSEGPRLPRAWKEYADRFKDPIAIREFGQAAGLDDFSASKVVYGLSLLGCVAPKQQETPEPSAEVSEPSVEAMEVPVHLGPSAEEVEADTSASGTEPEPSPPCVVDHPPEVIPAFRQRFHPSPSESAEAGAAEGEPALPSVAPEPGAQTPEPAEAAAPVPGDRGEPAPGEVRGPFSSSLPPIRPSRTWAMLSVFGGLLLLALASYWFVFLRTPAAAEETPSESVAVENPRAAGDDAGAAAPAPAPAQTADDEAQPSSPPEGVEKGASQEPLPEATPGTPPPQPSLAVMPGSFREARARLDAGEFAAAAREWAGALGEDSAAGFTLSIAIACRDDSLRKAAARTDPSSRFFVLPFALQERSCYRLCWGVYPSLEEAQSDRTSVPGFFLEEGGRPVVVSLRRAIPSSGH